MLLSDAVNRDRFVWTHLSRIIRLSKILYTQKNDIFIVININCFDILKARLFRSSTTFTDIRIIIRKVKAISCSINDLFEVVTCLLLKILLFENSSRKSRTQYDCRFAIIFSRKISNNLIGTNFRNFSYLLIFLSNRLTDIGGEKLEKLMEITWCLLHGDKNAYIKRYKVSSTFLHASDNRQQFNRESIFRLSVFRNFHFISPFLRGSFPSRI